MTTYKVISVDNRNHFSPQRFYNTSQQLAIHTCLGNVPLRLATTGQFNEMQTIQYYCAINQKWCDASGVKCCKKNNSCLFTDIILPPFIVNIPDNIKRPYIAKQAIYFDEKLYAFNEWTDEFTNINILSTAPNKTVSLFSPPSTRFDKIEFPIKELIYNNRYFIIWNGYLYELQWIYENEGLTLISRQHLKWIATFSGMCACGSFGIALTIRGNLMRNDVDDNNWVDQTNDYLIFYNPDQDIVYRLSQNDIQFKELNMIDYVPNVSQMLWSNEQSSITIHMQFHTGSWRTGLNSTSIAFEIHQNVLKGMKSKPVKDCYDRQQYAYNISFSEWCPGFECDNVTTEDKYDDFPRHYFSQYIEWKPGFQKQKSGQKSTDSFTDKWSPSSRAEYLYSCNHPSTNYKIIAGWNMEDQSHYNQLKHLQSARYKILSKLGDLADYLGSVIWYQYKGDSSRHYKNSKHTIHSATLVDFRYGLRSAKSIVIKKSYLGSDASLEFLDQCSWIGVIDNDDPDNEFEEESVSVPSFSLANDLNYFEVTQGRIICSDGGYSGGAEFGNAKKGKWYWKFNANEVNRFRCVPQIIAYHESVQNDERYTNDWELHEELFEYENNDDDCFVYDEDEDEYKRVLLELDSIDTSETGFQKLKELLYSVECLQNVGDIIIYNICEFCYFVPSLNWIEKPVLNGKWYLHRQRISLYGCKSCTGIFDYDRIEDEDAVGDPYEGRFGYEWFYFKEKNGRDMKSSYWNEMLDQSLQGREAANIGCGCIFSYTDGDKSCCIAKLDPVSKQVVSIRVLQIGF